MNCPVKFILYLRFFLCVEIFNFYEILYYNEDVFFHFVALSDYIISNLFLSMYSSYFKIFMINRNIGHR